MKKLEEHYENVLAKELCIICGRKLLTKEQLEAAEHNGGICGDSHCEREIEDMANFMENR